jgi:hypothetical protein
MTTGETYMLCMRCGGIRSGELSPTMRACVCSEALQMFSVITTPTLTEADVRRIVSEVIREELRRFNRPMGLD